MKVRWTQYLEDPKVTAAAGQYEAAYQLFERLRTALRLSAESGPSSRSVWSPRRLVRAEDFLDTLVGVYQDQSGSDAACPLPA